MEFGVNHEGLRISIFDANRNEDYFCPCCNGELIQRHGKIVIDHFAHKSKVECVDYYDNKGPWHRSMQDLFPESNREIFNNEFGNHFFDVLTDRGTIIEFQNSAISKDKFIERTEAYSKYSKSHGSRKPIWVFNYASRCFYTLQKGNGNDRFRKMRWYYPTKIFDDFGKDSDYELWFRVCPLKYKPDIDEAYTEDGDCVNRVIIDRNSRLGTGYLKIHGIFDNKMVYASMLTEPEFQKHVITL